MPAPRRKRPRPSRRRNNAAVLVICADSPMSYRLKQTLHSLGFGSVSVATSHVQGLERFKERPFSVVLFDAVPTNMPPDQFVHALQTIDQASLLIALSAAPQIDQVFDLLRAGARWFLALPFTPESLDGVLVKSVEGPAFSEGVLEAVDRNTALVGMILNSLENVTTTMHHIRNYPESPQSVAAVRRAFADSVELAKTFADGGPPALCEKLVDACVQRATAAPTRLGRVRRKLQRLRSGKGQKSGKKKRSIPTGSHA